MSLKVYRRWDSTCDKMMVVAWIKKPSNSLDSGHQDSARVVLYYGSMDKRSFFCQFWKLGFCSVSECEIFAHRGQLHIFLDRECVASVPTWNLPKHAFMTH